jgi:hypothetical protein
MHSAVLRVLAALVSYHLFEIRFLHLKRYFSYRAPASATEAAESPVAR